MKINPSRQTTRFKIEPPLTKRQQEELERRLEDYLANPKDVISWQEVKATALQKVKSC